MKIDEIDTALYRVPTSRPVGNAFFTYTAFEYVVVRIRAAGLEGLGWAYTLGLGGRAVKALVDELAPQLIGRELVQPAALAAELRQRVVPLEGIVSSLAVAAFDTAVWDLLARAANQPLHLYIGARRSAVPGCATGIDLNYSQEELVAQCGAWVDAGFRSIKVKVGKPTISEDLARLEAVRERIGADTALMIDANEAWTLGEARRRIDAYRHLELEYVEDPLPVLDVEAYRDLRRSSGVPIAGGERLWSADAVRQLITTGGVDVIRADVCRLGGVSEWLNVASLAQRFHVRIAPHMVEELALPLSYAVPNAHSVEVVPACNLTAGGVVHDAPSPAPDGSLAPRTGIGHGVVFDGAALERYLVN